MYWTKANIILKTLKTRNNLTMEKRKSKKFMANLLLQLLLVLYLLMMMEVVVVMAVDLLALEDGKVPRQDMDDNGALDLNHLIWQINTLMDGSFCQHCSVIADFCR